MSMMRTMRQNSWRRMKAVIRRSAAATPVITMVARSSSCSFAPRCALEAGAGR